MADSPNSVHVIGGGLAGSEAAWQLARAGVPTVLHEMRPHRATDAHLTGGLAELVCSNSFRSPTMPRPAPSGSCTWRCGAPAPLILGAGDAHRVPAGGALAVDRDGFSNAVEAALEAEPLVTVARQEIAALRRPSGTA